MFNPELYLVAYGRIYSNQGAMTPGTTTETADGMSLGKIRKIVELMRCERYRFSPVKRVLIPKKNGSAQAAGRARGCGIVPSFPGSFRVLFLSRIRSTR